MGKLQRNFKTYPTRDKVACILIAPFAVAAGIISGTVNVVADVIVFIRKYWAIIARLLVAVLLVAACIFAYIRFDRTVPKFDGGTDPVARGYVYSNCHKMANNFIVAEDGEVKGYVRADDNNIDRIIAVVMEYEFHDRDQLVTWLIELKNGNYSNAVEFHNYCWEKLDGKIGFAVELKSRYR